MDSSMFRTLLQIRRKGRVVKRALVFTAVAAVAGSAWVMAQPAGDPLIEGFRTVEVASVSDAIEQLYGERAYMSHEMRPLSVTKFAGPAVTVLLRKEEHKEGSAASQGMLDAIDDSPAGSVYVMVLENGADYAGIGGLMATAMKYRGFAGAVIDASVRDTPQIRRLQFPVFSRGVAPSTTINHYRVVGVNVPVTCAGVRVNQGDIVTADEDGVVGRAAREGAGGPQEVPGARRHRTSHAPVHREVPVDPGSGEAIRTNLMPAAQVNTREMADVKSPGVAAVLSAVIPGLGQFYNGDFLRGIFWLIVTPGLWIGSGGMLGWICHVIAAITAHHRARRKNRESMLRLATRRSLVARCSSHRVASPAAADLV